jgi:hypothetical protein
MKSPEIAEKLSSKALNAGSSLYRAHAIGFGAIFFGPGRGEPPKYRFDAPDGSYGVCYLGLSEEAAFIEGVIHRSIPRRLVSETTLANRAISIVHVRETIRAARLYGKYLVGNGADAAVTHGSDYTGLSQPWSKAIHDHPDCVDGIVYTARHDDSVFALALFERAAHKVEAGFRHVLSGHDLRTLKLLERFGIGLE